MLSWFAGLMTAAGLLLAGLAVYVARRRSARAGISLAVILVAVAWWGLAYALELSAVAIPAKSQWGDLKYIGVCALAPAWLVFVLQYTGRSHLVTPRVIAGLCVEPVVILALLFNPGTHDLVRFYPANAAEVTLPIVGTGPVFWVHFVYANVLLVVATAIFVVTMVRLSRTYRQMALVMVVAALLPWAANLLHNFEVAWFAVLDLTPFAFTVTGGVLVWGLFREHLIRLSPLARGVIVENMTDAVFILDAFGRVVDSNPAGTALVGCSSGDLVGRQLVDVLGPHATATAQVPAGSRHPLPAEIAVLTGGRQRSYDLRSEPLTDRRGRSAGELVVLRDVTDRVRAEQTLERLLAERSRVAAALQASLVPRQLPRVPAGEIVTRYEPAGDGHEIGGDFFDIFALDEDTWGVVLGDVSGKGAEAAAVTAEARYTLRTLANPKHRPSRTLRELNTRLLTSTDSERHCTLVYALLRPLNGTVGLTLSLAGHHPPLVVRSSGAVETAGMLGTALGLLEEVELHDVQLTLAPGDLICMYTDGLVEARDGIELFGSERVAATLRRARHRPTEQIATALTDAARQFHGGDLDDDLALLLLRARPAS